jgi:integrase
LQTHYVPQVSVNVLLPRRIDRATRARKRAMSTLHYTYADLKNIFSTSLPADLGIASSSLANLKTALKHFVDGRGETESTVIGHTLRGTYYKARNKHLQQLRDQGRSPEYVGNQKHCLDKSHLVLLEADRRASAARSEASPFQMALKELVGQRGSIKGTAREAGLAVATLRRWLDGAVPNATGVPLVSRLELHYGLPRGTLTELLPFKVTHQATPNKQDAVVIEYREALKALTTSHYAIHNANEALRTEWRELLHFKTEFGQFRRWYDGTPQVLRRQKTGRWKTTRSFVEPERASTWHSFRNGLFVPTAGINWNFFAQYLGWLRLPESEGGLAMPDEHAQTLAHLANGHYVERYLEWKIARSGGKVHGGITSFLKQVRSFCHPDTGYITQSWSVLGGRVGVKTPEQWQAMCLECYEAVKAKARDFADVEQRNRDPFAPIQQVLAMANPLEGVVDAVKRMDANRPTTGGRTEALWARDRLLLTLLISNALRRKNLQLITYKSDGTGHLRKVDGVWRICIPKEEFKNEKGAAKDRAYNMPVRQELWPHIEQYLAVHRPQLADPSNHYVFVSSNSRTGAWKNLARHFAVLTKRYLVGCPGVGPHAMRHIVATSILKQRPNDWETAAWVLHDKVATVKKAYAHLRSDDAARWSDPVMAAPLSRL